MRQLVILVIEVEDGLDMRDMRGEILFPVFLMFFMSLMSKSEFN
jgi:hypothetical protein